MTLMSDLCGQGGAEGYPSDCQLTEALKERAMQRNRPVERSEAWKAALPRARNVELLLLDVDGVLTDGQLHYSNNGEESKSFSTQDGLGLNLLQKSGVAVGIITARTSRIVERRAKELNMAHIYQGNFDKLKAYEDILKKTGLRPPQTAYMGDDWVDLPLLNRVGFAASPANGVVEIRNKVHYISEKSGGNGAVREVCDLIMEARGTYSTMFAGFDK